MSSEHAISLSFPIFFYLYLLLLLFECNADDLPELSYNATRSVVPFICWDEIRWNQFIYYLESPFAITSSNERHEILSCSVTRVKTLRSSMINNGRCKVYMCRFDGMHDSPSANAPFPHENSQLNVGWFLYHWTSTKVWRQKLGEKNIEILLITRAPYPFVSQCQRCEWITRCACSA